MFSAGFSAVLGFFLVVAPGLIFERLRERQHPTAERSVFRETSDVALASLIFGVVALAILGGIKVIWPTTLPDPKLWLLEGSSYVATHLHEVAAFFGGWIAISFLSAFGGAKTLSRAPDVQIDPHTTGWFEVFRKQRPTGTIPMALVALEDRSAYVGEVVYYAASAATGDREIVLGPPLWHRNDRGERMERLPVDDNWQRVVIPGCRIVAVWIRYPRSNGVGPVSLVPPTRG
jgi:hypothetical protein